MTIISDSSPAPLPMEKPLLIIEEIISIFLPYAESLQENKRGDGNLHLYENNRLAVALVTGGEVNIYHGADMMWLATARAPFIFGLQGSPFQYNSFNFKPEKNSKISVLPREKALEIIIKHHIFPQVLTYQTYLHDFWENRNNLLINKSLLQISFGLT
ncbi:hypothetical protein [Rahnella sp. PCH160]|uniref:hypothetical protein n=1 Tax=Rahnella sp. PCH160 TaxID=3447928 RepID=UPI0039FBC694